MQDIQLMLVFHGVVCFQHDNLTLGAVAALIQLMLVQRLREAYRNELRLLKVIAMPYLYQDIQLMLVL